MRERFLMCSSVEIVFLRIRIAFSRAVGIPQPPIRGKYLQELCILQLMKSTNMGHSKLEKVMMSLKAKIPATSIITSTSNPWIRYCQSKSTKRVITSAMEIRIRCFRQFKTQSWWEGHWMLDWEGMSSNVLIMVTRKYWILLGWRSLLSGLLKRGEGMKNGVKVLRKIFGVWIWRRNTTMVCRGHLEPIRQLMDFQPLANQ